MPSKAKDRNSSGLGRAIINRKIKDIRKQHESGLYTSDINSSDRLRSVTQEKDLDEFLHTAQLAGTQFTAERRNIKVLPQTAPTSQNLYLLGEQEEKQTLKSHAEHKARLRVPRRPPWTKTMTAEELDQQEKTAFLDWRRGLARLQEEKNFILTPFERNLEVWRQLWRVLERSHLVVQIVDARNPLRFRCEDLEAYVRDVERSESDVGTVKGKRRSVLLINKADLLTRAQRETWADYLDSRDISHAFFSAANAALLQQSQLIRPSESVAHGKDDREDKTGLETDDEPLDHSASLVPNDGASSAEEDSHNNPRTKILSVAELENWFLQMMPELPNSSGAVQSKAVVGLVGYPNVGKSSTINALLGEKKVSVSSTPGKTKHFQTIHLSDAVLLCDCPGLVFPQFATTKADLVCDGVLPIDHLREYMGPTTLVVRRIPREVLEATYGLSIKLTAVEEGGSGSVSAADLLVAHAVARGFMRSGQGNPDEARSARYVLKDYVNGKLLFCHPPPGISEMLFNQQTHEISLHRATGKKRAPVTRVASNADTFIPSELPSQDSAGGQKLRAFDRVFFDANSTISSRPFLQGPLHRGQAYSRPTMFPHQNIVTNDGTLLDRNQTIEMVKNGSKQHKKAKRQKHRSGKGYD